MLVGCSDDGKYDGMSELGSSEGTPVGSAVGAHDGLRVGCSDDGDEVGVSEGLKLGSEVGTAEGDQVGTVLGTTVDGSRVGRSVVGTSTGA